MQLSNFNAGINIRTSPHLLELNESQVHQNIDSTSGSIKAIKDKVKVQDLAGNYYTYYYGNSEFIVEENESHFVEYVEKLYRTKDSSYPTKYDGTNEYRLGIPKPLVAPTVTLGAIGVLDGTYQYCYTYYNINDGTESQPSEYSAEIVPSLQQVNIGIIASTDTQVTNIRIYRLGGNLTAMSLVEEVANTTTTYIDNLSDLDIEGTVLGSALYKEAPSNIKYFTEDNAILFGAVDDKLWYSEIGNFNYWSSFNFIDFPDIITGLGATQNGLLVFTKFKTYIITGTSPDTFTKLLLSDEHGCVKHDTIQFVDNTLLWLSTDGICASSGGSISLITLDKLGKFQPQDVTNAVVSDRIYYLSYKETVLMIDFRYGLVFKTFYDQGSIVGDITESCNKGFITEEVTESSDFGLIINSVTETQDSGHVFSIIGRVTGSRLVTANDKLYALANDELFELMSSPTDLVYRYKSPELTEGSFSNLKIFKDFYIRYNGDVTLRLYLDGTLINEVDLTGNTCYNLKALGATAGYGLTIELQGTAEIYEIEYKVLGRQNGK